MDRYPYISLYHFVQELKIYTHASLSYGSDRFQNWRLQHAQDKVDKLVEEVDAKVVVESHMDTGLSIT